MITAFVLALATLQSSDTLIPVSRGQRLAADVFAGSVTVRTWNRDAVQVKGEWGPKTRLETRLSGSTLSLETSAKYGPGGAVDVELTIPAWMGVSVEGVYVDVTVEGCKCAVAVETVQGDVIVRGAEGPVNIETVEGSVQVANVVGNLAATTVNEGITVTGVTGNVSVETVNGDVALKGVRSAAVEASTVNGDIGYDGEIRSGGTYSFSTHEGDVTVIAPADLSATVRVNTFSGEFESDWPVQLTSGGKRTKLNFTLGGGSATLDLESFNGDIHLVKAGAKPGR